MTRAKKQPKYGDEIFVPSYHADGHWTNGIVNSDLPGGNLLVAAPGHAKSNLVRVPIDGYLVHWCWPEDVAAKRTGVDVVTVDGPVTGKKEES